MEKLNLLEGLFKEKENLLRKIKDTKKSISNDESMRDKWDGNVKFSKGLLAQFERELGAINKEILEEITTTNGYQ